MKPRQSGTKLGVQTHVQGLKPIDAQGPRVLRDYFYLNGNQVDFRHVSLPKKAETRRYSIANRIIENKKC